MKLDKIKKFILKAYHSIFSCHQRQSIDCIKDVDKENYRFYLNRYKLIDLAQEAGFTESQSEFLERIIICAMGGQENPKYKK